MTGQGTSDNAAIQTHRDIVSGVKEKALCAKTILNPRRRRAEMKDKTIIAKEGMFITAVFAASDPSAEMKEWMQKTCNAMNQ